MPEHDEFTKPQAPDTPDAGGAKKAVKDALEDGVGSLDLPLEGDAPSTHRGVGSLDLPLEDSPRVDSGAFDPGRVAGDALKAAGAGDGGGGLDPLGPNPGLRVGKSVDLNPFGKNNPVGKLMPKVQANVGLDAKNGLTARAGIRGPMGLHADVAASSSEEIRTGSGARPGGGGSSSSSSKTTPIFYFETANLPPEVFLVTKFEGDERLSRPFHFEIDLVSQDAYVDFAAVINQPATLKIQRGDDQVHYQGIVVDFEQLGKNHHYVSYRAVLAPRVQGLTLTSRSRVFQDRTVEEIITQVLTGEEYGFARGTDFDFDLRGQYEPREYCVQFEESDLAFIQRLMEHEGIFYYFEHGEQREKLLITDHAFEKTPIEGLRELDYREEDGMLHEEPERIHRFVFREQVVPGKVKLKDYNYETPDEELLAEWPKKTDDPGLVYAYGEHYKTLPEGERLAQVRHEEIACRRRLLTGGSNCRGFRAGFLFTLLNHYRTDYNQEYLLLSIRHEGSQWQTLDLDFLAREGVPEETIYHNTFRCQPKGMPFRPARETPVPNVPGVMVARIEHPDSDPDDYGHLDDKGRYRARVNFDLRDTEEAGPATATLPIRMNQPYSGPDYGVHFPHHDGTEMLFACVNGDIDRPVALGTVPNPNEQSPAVVGNRWQNVIRTWGKNELTFDDKKGEENIYMHATKDHTVVVTNDESIAVGNDQAITVGHDRTKSVKNDETNTIQQNRSTNVVEGNELLVVESGWRAVNVNKGDDFHNVDEGSRHVDIGKDDVLAVTKNQFVYIHEGNREVGIGTGDDVLNVETGNRAVTIKGTSAHTAHGKLSSHSDEAMTVSSDDKIMITAKKEIVLAVGACSITLKKDGITVSGPKIASTAVGMHEISGAVVKIN